MSKYGAIPKAILRVIEENGPSTAAEICDILRFFTDSERNSVRKAIALMAQKRPQRDKQVYVHHWIHDAEGQRNYPRPVFAIGSDPCARKPKPKSHNELQRTWRDKRAARQINSVWALAVSKTERLKSGAIA